MAIQLSKGQRIDLTKTNPGLAKALIGLGWDTNKYTGGAILIWMRRLFLSIRTIDASMNATSSFTTTSSIRAAP